VQRVLTRDKKNKGRHYYACQVPKAALSDFDEILAAAYELADGQFFEAGPIDGLFVEFPVEVFQGAAVAELGLLDSAFDTSSTPAGCLVGDQVMNELQVG
jgi:hypothetical protein